MTVGPLVEWAYWDGLDDDAAAENTQGVPPYDAHQVALMVMARLVSWNMTDGPILDLGCGTGRLTSQMARVAPWHEFWAVDISQRMLDRVEPRENIRTYLCDGRALPGWEAESLSGAYSVTVFQHIPWKAQGSYIAQVARLLRQYGRFVFTIAMGTENEFLSHQVPDRSMVADWCWSVGLSVLTFEDQELTTGWTWVVAEKA